MPAYAIASAGCFVVWSLGDRAYTENTRSPTYQNTPAYTTLCDFFGQLDDHQQDVALPLFFVPTIESSHTSAGTICSNDVEFSIGWLVQTVCDIAVMKLLSNQ